MKDPNYQKGHIMASLPIIPVSTAITLGGLAVTGLVGYCATLRKSLDSQNLEIHRSANALLAEIAGGHARPTSLTPRSAQSS